MSIDHLKTIHFSDSSLANEEIYNTSAGPILTASTTAGLLASTFCLLYIYLWLKINVCIKAIFYFIASQNLLGMLITLINILWIQITEDQNMTKCSILMYIPTFVASCDAVLMTLISIFRYYMTWKASKTKIAKSKYLITGIIMAITFHYSFMLAISIAQRHFNWFSEIEWCANQNAQYIKSQLAHILYFAEILAVLGTGLFADLSLYKLIKKRNSQNGGKNLVPWRISAQADHNLGVPVRATLFTSLTMISAFVVIPIAFSPTYFGKFSIWINISVGNFWTAIQLPILLMFTISHQKMVYMVQPPKGLQFHEEGNQKELKNEPSRSSEKETSDDGNDVERQTVAEFQDFDSDVQLPEQPVEYIESQC